MKELRCPNCGKTFTVDEADYASILSQVKNAEFDAELARRIALLHEKDEAERRMSEMKSAREFERLLSEKDKEIEKIRAEAKGYEDKVKIAVLEEKSRAEAALKERDARISELSGMVKAGKSEAALREQGIKEKYELEIRRQKDLVDYYKDLKARMSTKMIGESLEVHCHNEFEKVRALFGPEVYFEKDNDASEGTKGDFIFRDSVDGVEYVSIMFEMKNEADETATKHRNEDFFQKLDSDRTKKDCEFAVLVSLLEPDSELYNQGIVDVSHRYPKMYVIRPQFFIPMITLLCQTSRKSLEYKKELAVAKNQSIDITNFEKKLDDFRIGFSRNFETAANQFENAIGEIDKSIAHLQKIKDALMSSGRNLRLANDKASELTIRKLTWGNPTMKRKFEEAGVPSKDDAD